MEFEWDELRRMSTTVGITKSSDSDSDPRPLSFNRSAQSSNDDISRLPSPILSFPSLFPSLSYHGSPAIICVRSVCRAVREGVLPRVPGGNRPGPSELLLLPRSLRSPWPYPTPSTLPLVDPMRTVLTLDVLSF